MHLSAFGTKRTCQPRSVMSAFGGKADMMRTCSSADFWRFAEQNPPIDRCVDVAAGQNNGNSSSDHARAFLHESRKRGGARAFRDIVRVLEIGPDRFGDIVLAQLQDAGRAALYDCQGLLLRIACRHSVGKSLRRTCWNWLPGFERQSHCWSLAGDDPNNFSFEAEKVAGRDETTDAGAHADRDIDRIEVGDSTKQLECVRGDAPDLVPIEWRDKMQILLACDPLAFGQRLVEISSELDHCRSESTHGGVLIRRVAARHENRRRNACP